MAGSTSGRPSSRMGSTEVSSGGSARSAASRRRIVVEADGGSRGNPGVAGYGAVVRDAETGQVLVERAAPLGRQSNNVAEYRGLIAGLAAALALAPGAAVDVRLDSKLVVEQMAGRWKVKHEDMRRLSLEAGALVRQMVAAGGSVSWTWIPRERNKAADRLSNEGMDGKTIDTLPAALGHTDSLGSEEVVALATETSDATPTLPFGSGRSAALATETSDAAGVGSAFTGSTRLLLVRHALTDFTAQGRIDGRGGADPDLNRDGRRQAVAVAGAVRDLALEDVRLVTSSLTRARRTGADVAGTLGVEAQVDAGWDEQAFGDWDGEVLVDLAHRDPGELRRLWLERDYRRPGGESTAQLEERVLQAYERAVDGPGTVVVITSRKPILVVLGHLLGLPHDRFWALATEPASLSAVELRVDGSVSVPFINRTGHLGLRTL